jgi:hypothetical protein
MGQHSDRLRVPAAYRSHPSARRAPNLAVRLSLTAVASILLLTPAASRQLTVIRVAAGEDLQSALDVARPGDTILLEPRARFIGNFILPNHSEVPSYVTIRTDSAGVSLPPEGVRTGPQYASDLATLQSPNSDPALRTARGAHHWRIENLAFAANADGHGNIIALGDGGAAQRDHAGIPHSLVLDRLYIRGDAALGQKRGIALNSATTHILNCYIADIKGVGVDTQAIGGWNGPGPYVIENNYLEAAGENVMFGGGDPGIVNLVPQNIQFLRNHVTKPIAWRLPLVTTPMDVRASTATVGGTLMAGTYTYRVAAERPSGQQTTALSEPSPALDVRLQSTSTGTVTLEWRAVPGAAAYRVYRRAPPAAAGTGGTTDMYWRTTTARFTDTGAPGTNGTPQERPTMWSVKNLFELKNARDVVIAGNVFEYNWLASQTGYAILIKPVNQDGGAPWSVIENVRFTNNVVRHVGSAINLHGMDDRHPSERARGITIANNVFVDVSHTTWGGAGDFLQIGGGPATVRIEHNTVFHTGRVANVYGGTRGGREVHGFVFRNNLLRHNQYGVKGSEVATGIATLTAFFPGAIFEGNVLAGGDRSRYPLGNHFPPADQFEAQFENSAGGNYRLRSDSPFKSASAEGRDIGVDMDVLEGALGGGVDLLTRP